jgi:hypothetical protein
MMKASGEPICSPVPCAGNRVTGAQPPPLWGTEDHVRALLGDRVTEVTTRRRAAAITGFDDADAFREYFKARYGPTIPAYRDIADDPDGVAALDRDLADLVRRHDRGTDGTVMDWEYLLLTARRPS